MTELEKFSIENSRINKKPAKNEEEALNRFLRSELHCSSKKIEELEKRISTLEKQYNYILGIINGSDL